MGAVWRSGVRHETDRIRIANSGPGRMPRVFALGELMQAAHFVRGALGRTVTLAGVASLRLRRVVARPPQGKRFVSRWLSPLLP